MNKKAVHILYLVVTILLLNACKPSVPEQYIQPGDMEDLLYDYHIARGMANDEGLDDAYKHHLYFASVLKKHGVTRAEFDSSLVYYYNRADQFYEIYKRVQDRLSDEALALGSSNTEVERFTTTSLTGDTTDIWDGKRQMLLMSRRPYHVVQFYQKADTAFRANDSFLLTFNGTWLTQNSNRIPTTVYLAVTYRSDTTITQHMSVSGYGPTSLRIMPYNKKVKEIKGFIHIGEPNNSQSNEDNIGLLFLNRIQLIRFHNKIDPVETGTLDGVKAEKSDTLLPDSMKPKRHRLGEHKPIIQ